MGLRRSGTSSAGSCAARRLRPRRNPNAVHRSGTPASATASHATMPVFIGLGTPGAGAGVPRGGTSALRISGVCGGGGSLVSGPTSSESGRTESVPAAEPCPAFVERESTAGSTAIDDSTVVEPTEGGGTATTTRERTLTESAGTGPEGVEPRCLDAFELEALEACWDLRACTGAGASGALDSTSGRVAGVSIRLSSRWSRFSNESRTPSRWIEGVPERGFVSVLPPSFAPGSAWSFSFAAVESGRAFDSPLAFVFFLSSAPAVGPGAVGCEPRYLSSSGARVTRGIWSTLSFAAGWSFVFPRERAASADTAPPATSTTSSHVASLVLMGYLPRGWCAVRTAGHRRHG